MPNTNDLPTDSAVSQLTVDLCRELYDRFVMGGWVPQDAHSQTEAMIQQHFIPSAADAGPRQPSCPVCKSQMIDVRLCLSCGTNHGLSLLSNRGHKKSPCSNAWHDAPPVPQEAAPLTPYGEALLQRIEDYRSGYSCGYSDRKNGQRMRDKDAAQLFFGKEAGGIPDIFVDDPPVPAPDVPERLWCSYPDCPCDREHDGVCQYKRSADSNFGKVIDKSDATAPDWTMRVAEQICRDCFRAGDTSQANHIAALIREAGSERERELRGALQQTADELEVFVKAKDSVIAVGKQTGDVEAWKRHVHKAYELVTEASRLLGGESK